MWTTSAMKGAESLLRQKMLYNILCDVSTINRLSIYLFSVRKKRKLQREIAWSKICIRKIMISNRLKLDKNKTRKYTIHYMDHRKNFTRIERISSANALSRYSVSSIKLAQQQKWFQKSFSTKCYGIKSQLLLACVFIFISS